MYNAPMAEPTTQGVIWKTIGVKKPEKALLPLAPYAEYLLLERGYSPRGVRRYLQDLALWFRFLEARALPPGPEAVRAILLEERWAPRRVQGFPGGLEELLPLPGPGAGRGRADPTEGIGRPKAGRRLPLHPAPEELLRFLEALARKRRPGSSPPSPASSTARASASPRPFPEGQEHRPGRRAPRGRAVVGKGNKERLVPLSRTAQSALLELGPPQGNVNVFTFAQGRYRGRVPSARYVEAKFREAALAGGPRPQALHPPQAPPRLRHAPGGKGRPAGRRQGPSWATSPSPPPRSTSTPPGKGLRRRPPGSPTFSVLP
jgi:integrase/recombinase XerD